MSENRAFPDPPHSAESIEFLEAANQGRLLIRRCNSCGEAHWYPRTLCPFCFNPTVWEQASGKGVIYAFSIARRFTPTFVIAYVTLAEGPTMLTNLVDCDATTLSIGQSVQVSFKRSQGGVSIACFSTG